MDLGRFEIDENTSRKQIPNEWTEELTKILTESYFDQSEKDNCFFDVYGEIYEKEFVVIISYLHHEDQLKSPISVFISHDVVGDTKTFSKVLDELVNLVGLVYDDIFSDENWNEYSSTWTENKFKGHDYFYRVTRENISLSLQADQILKKGSVDF